MRIETPEYREILTTDCFGEYRETHYLLPTGLPGKNGAVILMLANLKYFLEMCATRNERNLQPYEILARFQDELMQDVQRGEIAENYMVSYKRDPRFDGEVLFDFSHFEINTETEPDENYRSLYIYYEFTGSVS
ncbi:MAG: hypothetical protein E7100_01795 [Bacteroidaceae bacterium]|jgi:hypothetical protein|nr:hypothetical protein [Bacteroidaceae bacterium]